MSSSNGDVASGGRHSSISNSGFRGVTPAGGGLWRASLSSQAGNRVLGIFDTAEDAARAYDGAARTVYGDKARLNYPNLAQGERTAGGRSRFVGLSW